MSLPIGDDGLFSNPRMSVDDSVLYLSLIHSLLPSCRSVVDVGCGRGAYADRQGSNPNMFDLRGPDRHILGLDLDPAAARNPFLDDFQLLNEPGSWPTADGSADLVVSDWTLEHVRNPEHFVSELSRTLRPGGVFIARSVSRFSALGLASRLVPNKQHPRVIRRLQPSRPTIDVFPAYYRMNTPRALAKLLPDFEFTLSWRPALENYVRSSSPRLAKITAAVERLLPQRTHTVFVVCARLAVDDRSAKVSADQSRQTFSRRRLGPQ